MLREGGIVLEKVTVPQLQFAPALPTNMAEMFEAQARCLIAYGVPIDLDDAMKKANEFVYSLPLAERELNLAWMVPYGVSSRQLAEAGGVVLCTDPDKFTLYNGVLVPEGLQVIQGQLGRKYKGTAPRDVRQNHDSLEELGVSEEGLAAFLYWGPGLLKESNMDFPGSVAGRGDVPYLFWDGGEPELDSDYGGNADPDYGSVSRGK